MPGPDAYERFTRLFLQHEPEILRAVMVIIPERADARDILQDTAVTLWKHFERYDPSRPFTNWALGYARIQMRRFLRSGARRATLSERAAVLLEQAQDERSLELESRDVALRECLAQLPAHSREVLLGYYFAECTVEQLAQSQGRSVEAIYKNLQRLRSALLDCITHKLSRV
jgi:RNA polymerase sigma-70 factor, ECF subfamily